MVLSTLLILSSSCSGADSASEGMAADVTGQTSAPTTPSSESPATSPSTSSTGAPTTQASTTTASPTAQPTASTTEVVAAPDSGTDPTTRRVDYGTDARQYGLLTLPGDAVDDAAGGSLPVVVLVHGGFWRNRFFLDLMFPLVDDLAARGYAVWNLEYRSVGDPGGGYPGTLQDVAAGVDLLAEVDAPLDLDRVAVVGHSAGGHLVAWLGSRGLLADGEPGSQPEIAPVLVVPQAGVVDLLTAHAAGLGSGAVADFMGGSPEELAEAYRVAQPVLDERVRLVHGSNDAIVPPSQSQDAADRVAAVTIVEGADHFDVIDPAHESWAVVAEWLDEVLLPSGG